MRKRIWATLDPFVEGGEVLGRKVANASFLTALLRADPYDEYHFFLESEAAEERQRLWLRENFPRLAEREAFAFFPQQALHQRLAETRYDVFHLSDCLHRQVALARLRNAYAEHLFPITAPTHSLSYERFMPGYLAHLWPGACGQDVIVATSASAEAMLERTFTGLEAGYGLDTRFFHRPRLERIPLGIDPSGFPHADERWDAGHAAALAMRQRLGIDGEVLFLCLARISTASKMDCLPLITAFARAGESGLDLRGCCLVLAGWAEDGDPLPETLRGYAHSKGLRLIPLLRPTDEERRALYAAADVFLSPSDNIQETFGLTLAEAGASGLPVIASDFDGYRDIVVHEETGMLIPTLGAAQSGETNLLAGLWYDNQYHLKLAQETAVDIPALAGAIQRLSTDSPLRRRLGEAGRVRCQEHFSWDGVINRYLDLWKTLADTPLSPAEKARVRSAVHPLAMDFAASFRTHFTETLGPLATDGTSSERTIPDAAPAALPGTAALSASSRLFRRTAMGDALYEGRTPPLRYAGHEYMLDAEALRRVLLAARKPATGEVLLEAAQKGLDAGLPGPARNERAAFAVLWAVKQGYLEGE